MTLKRSDLGDERDPNPDKDRQYQQPELKSENIPGRSFAGTSFAEDQRHQARDRNSGPPARGNDTDDVQLSDRTVREDALAGPADGAQRDDTARRANTARTELDAERREETDQNL
ncbi:MAG TPA: hypothetical protein VFS08_20800 [Gemmatimonadaceae bacterium]|nr:hypothetical protein [Gemmatimonadaceae bacterium]